MFLPISINIKDKPILVVGGGNVALHKIKTLVKFTRNITVFAPEIKKELFDLGISAIKGVFIPDILDAGFFLVYACTNDPKINQEVLKHARKRRILVNVADDKNNCDFISPAITRSIGMTVAIDSQGENVRKSVFYRNMSETYLSLDKSSLFFCLGVDFKTASIDVREEILLKKREVKDFLLEKDMCCELLTTCNRIEIYGQAKDVDHANKNRKSILEEFPLFKDYGYFLSGTSNVFQHLCLLASGLNSQLFAEQQILAQLVLWKDQFEGINNSLKNLVEKSLSTAQEIRKFYGFPNVNITIADIVQEVISKKEEPDGASSVFILGTGKVAELFANLEYGNIEPHFISQKKISKAQRLAKKSNGKAHTLNELEDILLDADFLVCATSAPSRILNNKRLSTILEKRDKRLTIFDLSIPRDVDTKSSSKLGIDYYDLDSMDEFFKPYRDSSREIRESCVADISFLLNTLTGNGEGETFKIGTRGSALALKQTEEFQKQYPNYNFKVEKIITRGDKDKSTPLTQVSDPDFFTREIEEKLMEGEIDIAIHSAKDLEDDLPDDLITANITPSISPFDCIVYRKNYSLRTLPATSIVGTSSHRRAEAIVDYRRDLVVKDIRGNIDERLEQLDNGDYDAIVIAHAALIRLGLTDRISDVLPLDIISPDPLQGRLAVQIRRDRTDLLNIFGGA